MQTTAVEHLLLSQLADAERPDLFSLQSATRRNFLSGLALAAGPAPVILAGSGAPQFSWSGRALRVAYGGASWLIDPGAFAGRARLGLSSVEDEHLIALTGARFAGTALRTDLTARIYRALREWRVALKAPGFDLAGDLPLRRWLQGEEVRRASPPRTLTIGGNRVRISEGHRALSAQGGLTLSFMGDAVRLDGRIRCKGEGLTIRAWASDDAGAKLARLAGGRGGPTTHFEIMKPQPGRLPDFTLGGHGACRPKQLTAVTGAAFEDGGPRAAAMLVEGGGALTHGTPGNEWGERLELERFAAFIGRDAASIAGRVAGGQRISGAAMSGLLARDGHQPLMAHFPASGAATLNGRLALDSLWLPLADGERATIDFRRAPATVALGWAGTSHGQGSGHQDTGFTGLRETLGAQDASAHAPDLEAEAAGAPRQFSKVVVLPRTGQILYDDTDDAPAPGPAVENAVDAAMADMGIGLDESRIELRRDADLLNLEFRLIGFRLRGGYNRRPYLDRTAAAKDARIVVEFQPQHVWETVHNKPPGCTAPSSTLSEARMSGRSRLAFRPKDGAWRRRLLNVEDLTDWSELDLVVDRRAAGALARGLDSQLELPGILASDSALGLFRKVSGTLQKPGPDTTALELAARLFFSPAEEVVNGEQDKSARVLWERQARGTESPGEPLWNVRLNEAGRRSVRAIWSSYLKPGELYQDKTARGAEPPPLALTPTNHWEIVAQTSVYGLPALRRLEPEVDRNDPIVASLKKIPRGGVIRPEGTVRYLDQIDDWHRYRNDDTGIALATPFDDADISLTALGGVFRARWEGEPAQLRPDPTTGSIDDPAVLKIAPSGFSLEQITYQTWLGRDIRVIAVTKGYLFPLGLRASYVTVAERRFYPDPAANGAPVSYEVLRQFIRCRPDPKTYPGINQPYRSRDFPAQSVTMRTLITPDLEPPGAEIGEALAALHRAFPDPSAPRALPINRDRPLFWPRIAGGDGSDFQFQWTTDSGASATSPLIFVDSAYAGVERVMKLLAKDYYAKADPGRRTARFFGARQRYAPDDDQGRTSFDTDNWLLEARGQIFGEAGDAESFVIDGRMQGADQPPFYPLVTRAQIAVQSLDRLLGAPQGLISVAFHDKYRKLGFGDPNHPSDIYLSVLGPRIALDVSDRSQTSGGLASPNALVAAISRKTGIVGGKDLSTSKAVLNQKRQDSEYEGGFDFSQAEIGRFDPVEFFGFKDAKLLGVLDLKTVIKAALSLSGAPRLIEEISYGALEGDQGLDRIRAGAAAAAAATTGFLALFEDLKNQVDVELGPSLTLRDLYPDLVDAVAEAKRVLPDRFTAIADATRVADVSGPAMAILSAARPLLREIERLARDPVPPAATAIVGQLNAFWETVVSAFEAEWNRIASDLLQAVASELGEAACALIDAPGHLEGPFFGASRTTTCSDFLANPGDIVANSREALFRDAFATPLARLLTAAGDLGDVASKRFELAQDAVRVAAMSALKTATQRIAHRLAPWGAAGRDLRDVAVQAETARAVATALAAKLRRDFATNSISRIAEAFVEGLEEELRREIGKLESAIHPAAPPPPPSPSAPQPPAESAAAILADFHVHVRIPLRDAAIAAVAGEADKILRLMTEQAAAKERQLMARMGQLLSDALTDLLKTAAFARIARLGRSAAGWCDASYGVGRDFAIGVIADMATLDAAVLEHRADLLALDFDALPPDLGNRAHAIRSELLQLLALFETDIAVLRVGVSDLPAGPNACGNLQAVLDPVRRIILARNSLVPRLAAQAEALARLRRLIGGALQVQMQGLARQLSTLLGDITSINRLEASGVLAAVRRMLQSVDRTEPYRTDLEAELSAMQTLAADLRGTLGSVVDADLLPALAAQVQGYAEGFDRTVAARVLQSSAMTSAAIDQWEKGASAAIRAAARVMAGLHTMLRNAFDRLQAVLTQREAAAFVEFVLGTAAFDRLNQAIGAIRADDELLARISDPRTADAVVVREAEELLKRWDGSEPAVALAVSIISDFIADFVSGNLAGSLAARIRDALKAYGRELRELLTQFVPTRIETGYHWDATIDPSAIFQMSERPPDPGVPDLRLSVKASIDIVSGKRELTTSGTLQPFQLMLLPSAHMATLFFGPLAFESRNGSSPDFDLKVENVEIGPLLAFLEPLRAFMAPQGNGFYITPSLVPPGIEAGFQFGSALIQVGSLSFQNVFIRVSAWLPFGQDPARFTFAFASEERPFLISNPPYGGGGYVILTAEPGGDTHLELSFVFGGVSAVKFGPLNAQGRIVAGIGVRSLRTGTTLWALFEASGEGSIACFSVSISLRVTVWHYPNGQMVGQTRYRFTFKLGFVKYRYGVTARYELKKGGGRNQRGLAAPGPTSLTQDTPLASAMNGSLYEVTAPRKERNWAGYRRHIDSSLL